MMHHPYILEILVHEQRTNLLREAESHRLARRAGRNHMKQTFPLKRSTLAIVGLLSIRNGLPGERNSVLTERVIANGSQRGWFVRLRTP